VKSRVTVEFLSCFSRLPESVKSQARRAYQIWRQNPMHPGLHFKRVGHHDPVYSVRIGLSWRALGLLEGDTVTWFWIGSHADYDSLV
jgi:hypothetical protein